MITVDRTERVGFIPSDQKDLPEKERTTLYFKPLRKRKSLNIGVRLATSGGDQEKMVDTLFEIVAASLCGWSNIVDQNGGPVVFDEGDMESNFDIFDVKLLEEAAAFVLKISGLTGEDAKN